MVDNYNDLISIVVRTVGNKKKLLQRAIFSIYCSVYPNKEVILVYQGSDVEFLEYLENFKLLYKDIEFIIIHNDDTRSDGRAKNINLATKKANGRYLAFLDDDDEVSQDHYQNLIAKLREENFVWGYADCCRNFYQDEKGYLIKKEYPYRKNYSLDQLLIDNLIPIHSFIIDLQAIKDQSIIETDETLHFFEDYYIVLNMASRYMPFIIRDVGVFYSDHNIRTKINYIEGNQDYLRSRIIIDDLKSKINSRIRKCNDSIENKNKLHPVSMVKLFYYLMVLICYKIPFLGKRLISKKKITKFITKSAAILESIINNDGQSNFKHRATAKIKNSLKSLKQKTFGWFLMVKLFYYLLVLICCKIPFLGKRIISKEKRNESATKSAAILRSLLEIMT